MTPLDTPLRDLHRKPRNGKAPDSLVVLLHGLGADANDLIGLADAWGDLLPGTQFVSPDAPFPCDIAPFGRQWFSMQVWSLSGFLDGVRQATAPLEGYLEGLHTRFGLPWNRIALVGFSQGCIMALHVGLRRPERLAGIVGYSGLLIGPEVLANELRTHPPVVLVHGDSDPVVPVSGSIMARDVLGRLGVPVTFHIDQGVPHSITPQGLRWGGLALREWLQPQAS
jgi:phospholipase/carboxylesterase